MCVRAHVHMCVCVWYMHIQTNMHSLIHVLIGYQTFKCTSGWVIAYSCLEFLWFLWNSSNQLFRLSNVWYVPKLSPLQITVNPALETSISNRSSYCTEKKKIYVSTNRFLQLMAKWQLFKHSLQTGLYMMKWQEPTELLISGAVQLWLQSL